MTTPPPVLPEAAAVSGGAAQPYTEAPAGQYSTPRKTAIRLLTKRSAAGALSFAEQSELRAALTSLILVLGMEG